MNNKIINKLIVFLGVIVFSFTLSNSALASYGHYAYSTDPIGYESDYIYQQRTNNPIYTSYYVQPVVYPITTTTTAKPTTSVVNNYYYQTAPAVAKVATTTTSTEKSVSNTNSENNLVSSAYNPYANSGNSISALSIGGSGSFMPSSIWQWIFVVFLILIIIIVARMFIHKPSPEDHDTAHVH